jgi:hypothetical protein
MKRWSIVILLVCGTAFGQDIDKIQAMQKMAVEGEMKALEAGNDKAARNYAEILTLNQGAEAAWYVLQCGRIIQPQMKQLPSVGHSVIDAMIEYNKFNMVKDLKQVMTKESADYLIRALQGLSQLPQAIVLKKKHDEEE